MISMIAAVADGNVIGGGNTLLWHISEDMRHFKALTTGHVVVMGRKTFVSMGRPLPDRTNVVISSQPDFAPEGCLVARSLDEAVGMFAAGEEIFIIGGGRVYAESMHMAERLYITRVMAAYEGDTFFPKIEPEQWVLAESEYHPCGRTFDHPFEFRTYLRRESL